MPRTVARLADLVRIPSVSWDAYDRDHVRASAEHVAGLLRDTGLFERVEIDAAEGADGAAGQPAVIATRAAAPGRPTVLLYAHHDVQPQGADADWDTPPFEPTLIDGRLHGRGASDDKAGVISHVAALEALRDLTDGDLGVGVNVFIEGEEENGSRSFPAMLARHADVLRADAIIVADSDNPSTEIPGLTVSLRGNVAFNLTFRTLAHASHSGMYGGAVPDAMLAATRTLASLWDADGSVAVAGLTLNGDDTDALAAAIPERELVEHAGLLDGVAPIGRGSVAHRLWNQPSITITGIDAPSVADASNTILPAVTVRVSARIAPGQDPDAAFDALRRHLEEHAAHGVRLEFADVDRGAPFLVDAGHPAVEVMTAAMRDAWGSAPQRTGIGGSIPFIADLVREFPGAAILVTGVEDPGTRAHSPNESQHLGVLERAILTEALFLARFGA